MKIEATKKYINNLYQNKIVLGYCDLYDLLHTDEPTYYTHGVYGWNADIYRYNFDTVIVTGYRPFGNIRPDYKVVKKYEEKAKKVIEKYPSFNGQEVYEKRQKALKKLLVSFVAEVLGE